MIALTPSVVAKYAWLLIMHLVCTYRVDVGHCMHTVLLCCTEVCWIEDLYLCCTYSALSVTGKGR